MSVEISVRSALVRSSVYKLLAKSFLYPTQEVYAFVRSSQYQDSLSDALAIENLSTDVQREIHALRGLTSSDQIPPREELEKEYNRLFAHLSSTHCPPYETEYGYENVYQKMQAMADIAGFYHAYGLETTDREAERVDFISTELEFMSYLTASEMYALENNETEHLDICVDTQKKFIRDHLGRWLSLFTKMLFRATSNEFYLLLGKLTEAFLNEEIKMMGIKVVEISAPNPAIAEAPEPFDCTLCQRSVGERK